MSIVTDQPRPDNPIAGGVDTHGDFHVAAAIDPLGRELGHRTFPTTSAGNRKLLNWLDTKGSITVIGIEGTGAYGAGLTRVATPCGANVVEVDRPNRKSRRFQGKSDPIDAYAAARAALSGRASGTPKSRDGNVEMIRVLRIARTSAVKSLIAARTQLKAVIKTAPEDVREELRTLDDTKLITKCGRLRPTRGATAAKSIHAKRKPVLGQLCDPTAATKHTLKVLARRVQALSEEIKQLDDDLAALVTDTAPTLAAMFGVGPDVAGQILTTRRR